ncbi:WD40 repeat-like protein [Boletus reticuloceps]|uniref:WD40 repeat-like protein n=1 Tax=Boletus reticuloceps TaxID=495285 RepID=A0A8I2YYL3_9AGAM|nr:WD40 repeat-like protein [Boletus reticuloceps]
MRAQHTAHSFPAFPVYSCAFIADDQVVVGAGGGASRTGIKNKLRLFRVSDDRQLHTLSELELEKDEDAPMSMTAHPQSRTLVCGINSSAEKLQKGENENCRKFSVSTDEQKFAQLATCGTLTPGSLDDYQRVTVLSPNSKYLVAAGAHDFSLLDYDTLSPVIPSVRVSEGEIYDATFSLSRLFLATSSKLFVYALPTHPDGDESSSMQSTSDNKQLDVIKTIELPSISGVPSRSNVTFRAARLHPTRHDTLYTVVNATLPRVKHEKFAKKRAYVLKWKISEKDASLDVYIETIRKVCDGNLTCFDVSSDGRLLAFGASDYSLGVLDSNTLTPLLSILKAHEFPVTTLRFSPTSKLLVSGGVDSSIRVVSIPEILGGQSWNAIIFVIIGILIIIIAVLMPR